MISNGLRAINFNICNIREIQEVLNDVNEQLSDLMFSETFKDDDSKKYQIHKIKIFIQRNSIYSMPINELENYIKKLIIIIDYVIYEV